MDNLNERVGMPEKYVIDQEIYDAAVHCPDILLTRQQAGEFCGVTKSCIRFWESTGKIIPTTTVGNLNERRYSLKYLMDFVHRHRLYQIEKETKHAQNMARGKALLKDRLRATIEARSK